MCICTSCISYMLYVDMKLAWQNRLDWIQALMKSFCVQGVGARKCQDVCSAENPDGTKRPANTCLYHRASSPIHFGEQVPGDEVMRVTGWKGPRNALSQIKLTLGPVPQSILASLASGEQSVQKTNTNPCQKMLASMMPALEGESAGFAFGLPCT